MALLCVQAAWLLGVNLALSLPGTQAWLNTLRPERFELSWERAWSLYPGHVSVDGARVSGQTPRQQWQVQAQRARGRVALLPLLWRTVRVTWAEVEHAAYRQRPRLEPGAEPDETFAWYPAIEGYAPTERTGYPPPRPAWTVTVEDARLDGRHHAWIRRVQADFEASATVRVDTRSQGGPLALAVDHIDLRLDRAWADDGEEILNTGRAAGSYRLGPYRYREHRGLQSLRFTDLDLDLALETRGLEFVRLFLLRYPALKTGGQGTASGRVSLRAGRVAAGTSLRVEATGLTVAQAPFIATGDGQVHIDAVADADLPLSVAFRFGDLAVLHEDDRAPFFTGSGLNLVLENDGELVAAEAFEAPVPPQFRARLDVPKAVVDDMRTFNRYLPPTSPFTFSGGSADLVAKLLLTPGDAAGEFTLSGEGLRARLGEQDLGLALHVDGVVAGGTPSERKFDLAGSELRLDHARVIGEAARFEAGDWSAHARLRQADLLLERPIDLDLAADLAISDTRPLTALFVNHGGPGWVARRLELGEVTGAARLRLNERRVYVSDATLQSSELAAGMRGIIHEPAPEGMVYLRYKRVDAALRFGNGESDVIVFSPKEKFDAYRIDTPPVP